MVKDPDEFEVPMTTPFTVMLEFGVAPTPLMLSEVPCSDAVLMKMLDVFPPPPPDPLLVAAEPGVRIGDVESVHALARQRAKAREPNDANFFIACCNLGAFGECTIAACARAIKLQSGELRF
jgi:hypothetical protein